MDETLRGRLALVTGASRGIGRAIALALARAGADVAINFREREADAEALARELRALGRRAVCLRADVSRDDQVASMVAAAVAQLGPVEILVNNAGIAPVKAIDQLDAATWDHTLSVNLRSAFLVTQAVLPSMRVRRFGRLLFISSTAAQVGGIIGPHYAASKAGLLGLMHGYASQLALEGITANAIAPALVETEMISGHGQARPEALPVGRFGRPEEIGALAVAVVSNGFITGQTLQANGGLYPT